MESVILKHVLKFENEIKNTIKDNKLLLSFSRVEFFYSFLKVINHFIYEKKY